MSSRAFADDPPPVVGGETVVVLGAPRGGPADLTGAEASARDRTRALASAPFVTVVHVDDHAGERATVADLVGATVGAHVRSLGGLGAFASISVRGEAPGQTAVFVDGVPVSRIASVTSDLGRFDSGDIDRLELYRGGAPVEYGGAALGGALDIITPLGRGPRGEVWHAKLGGGSFGARELRVARGDGDPSDLATWASIGYAGATGDFSYFDDGGTNLDPSDDHVATRSNDGYDQLDGAARAGGVRGSWTWRGGVGAMTKKQGVPGSAWAQSTRSTLSTWSGLASAQAIGTFDPIVTTARAYALVEAQRYRDPFDEIGVNHDDRRYLTISLGATSAWKLERGRHDASAAVDLRGDWFRDEDATGMRPTARGRRGAIGLALADDLAFDHARVIVTPAARLDAARTDPIGVVLEYGKAPAPARSDLLPSPRLGVRVLATDDFAIKASAGWYARMPTVVELYGDRGFVVGTPDLRPETGPSADLGLVWAPDGAVDDEGDFDRVMIEAAGFVARPRDAIAFVATGGLVARPLNLGDADVRGGELAVTWRLAKLFTFAGNYTFADATQRSTQMSYDGKRIPGRPVHELYARGDLARTIDHHLAVVFADVAYTAGSFLDQSNLDEIPPRALIGAGVKVELGGGVLVGVEGKNLGDLRVEQVALRPPPSPDLTSVPRAIADFGGYPLPGRAFYLTLEWNH
ncbi:MAG TPA: TonB-dependent receptor [Kofleriaceae bacterium]|nr:TonB-dependent receptor [Kofleriaceae bacterium]